MSRDIDPGLNGASKSLVYPSLLMIDDEANELSSWIRSCRTVSNTSIPEDEEGSLPSLRISLVLSSTQKDSGVRK